jgi:uncharacterized protein YkwD
MKVVSWLGAGVLFLAVAFGTVSALRLHSNSATPVRAVAAAPKTVSDASSSQPVVASPAASPKPKVAPVRVKAPIKAAAPVRRTVAPAIVIGSTQQALINRDRAAHGLRPLTWSSCLASVARSNAARMSAQDYISHTNGASLDLGCHLGYQGGENVGWWSGGVNDAQLNSMFMNSPEHKANILGPYHYVATAWVTDSDGYAYVAVEFG